MPFYCKLRGTDDIVTKIIPVLSSQVETVGGSHELRSKNLLPV